MNTVEVKWIDNSNISFKSRLCQMIMCLNGWIIELVCKHFQIKKILPFIMCCTVRNSQLTTHWLFIKDGESSLQTKAESQNYQVIHSSGSITSMLGYDKHNMTHIVPQNCFTTHMARLWDAQHYTYCSTKLSQPTWPGCD